MEGSQARRFGLEHLSHSLGAMNAIDEPGRVGLQHRGASARPLRDLRPKATGIVGHLSIRGGQRRKIWTRLLCLGSKTFNPERGKAHEVLTEQNNELTIFNQKQNVVL